MADTINLAGNMPPEMMAEQQQLNRQQRMADLLTQQGMQGLPSGSMVSGHFVPTSPFQHLAQIANVAAGQYLGKKGDEQALALAQKLRTGEQSAMTDFIKQKQGSAGVEGGIYGPNGMTTQTTPDMYNADMSLNPQYKQVAPVAAQAPNPQAAYENLYNNPLASAKQREFAFTKMNEGPMKVGVEGTLLDPNTLKPLYQGAGKLPATLDVAVSLIPNLPRNRAEWTPAQMNQVENKVMQLEKAKASSTHITMPSAEERKAGFMSTILDRNILQMQTALGVDPKAVKPNVPASVVEAITGPNLLSRSMKPAQRQIIEDSQLDVLDAALTLRTGAAYTPVQLSAMRDTYFPKLGDKPAAVTAKRQRLESLLEGAYIASGRATPQRVSTPYVAQPAQPNLNQQLNVPSIVAPKFLGFESSPTGQ